jgi:hypothetical protein
MTKKTPEQSLYEIFRRNDTSTFHTSAYTIWRDEFYERRDEYEKFRKFTRWFDPSWTLPSHVEKINSLFIKYFPSHKIVITNKNEGVPVHLNASRSLRAWDWKKWHTWSYTIGVPFNLNEYNNDVYLIYSDFIKEETLPEISTGTVQNFSTEYGNRPDKLKILPAKPFTRLSFPSSRILHGVCASSTVFVWMFSDMEFIANPPHTNIDHRIIPNIEEMDKDMEEISGMTRPEVGLTRYQFMSDLDYYIKYRAPLGPYDYTPPNLN